MYRLNRVGFCNTFVSQFCFCVRETDVCLKGATIASLGSFLTMILWSMASTSKSGGSRTDPIKGFFVMSE